MSHKLGRVGFSALCVACLAIFAMAAPSAWGQEGTASGRVTVTVIDQSGGVVAGAQLQLQDTSTNDVRNAVTQAQGGYTFVNLSLGTYKLTITKAGFETQIFDSVTAQAAQTTDIKVTLKVAAIAGEKVEVVENAAPLVDTTSNAIGTTMDMKQIMDLPLGGRSLTGLASLVPGYANGTWDGLPAFAQGNNVDGVAGNTNRMKFGGDSSPAVPVRIENIQEMTVQTDSIDTNQGGGTAAMQINYVTRRGTNSFHGLAYEDFQNSYLNANSWSNDARGVAKNHTELNNFGGSVGGPILKNKLFFFGTFAEQKQPGTFTASRTVLTPAAQAGNFTFTGTDNLQHTVNVLTDIAQPNGLPYVVNGCENGCNQAGPTTIQGQQNTITSILNLGTLSARDANTQTLSWNTPNPQVTYYPTIRLDYNVSQNFRLNFVWDETQSTNPFAGAPDFPGAAFADQIAGNRSKVYTAGIGFDWTMRPTLINSFRGGFLYNYSGFGYNVPSKVFTQFPQTFWPFDGSNSGQTIAATPIETEYPLLNLTDTMTWQHGAHTVSFGGTWYREQDHYWNPPEGDTQNSFGLVNGDPALTIFEGSPLLATASTGSSGDRGAAEALYAQLTGRLSDIGGRFAYDRKNQQYIKGIGEYPLDELSKAWGLFFQDSYRIRSNFTLNYGLRWDFTGDDHDLTSFYHNISPGDVFGPSGFNNLFNPGSFLGNPNPQFVAKSHQYKPWNVSPQPQIGIAWNPQITQGFLGKLAGGGQTVIRAGYSVKKYTEPYQYFWDYATDQGQFYYQSWDFAAANGGAAGTFAPGTQFQATGNTPTSPLLAGGAYDPRFVFQPTGYAAQVPMSTTALVSGGFPVWGMQTNIPQPYHESWNLGIQRQIGNSNAIEVRYLGSRDVHQWLGLNVNEENIFQSGPNGFLTNFQQAQRNLTLNNAAANASAFPTFKGTFAYNPAVVGEAATPLFDAAFAGETGSPLKDYKSSTYINYLNQGQAGRFVNAIDTPFGTTDYYCNLVGAAFAPCATNQGYTGAGAGLPSNFFQSNPFSTANSAEYMNAGGYSNYNALQVDFRQKQWHGMQFDANYTWSHNLALNTRNDWEATLDDPVTLRDLHASYAPSMYDIRHTLNVSGTYDLPFGKGKPFVNRGGLLDRVVGGWTVGTIVTFHTGTPFNLTGGFRTFDNYADGGAVLNGLSRDQLQGAVGVFRIAPNGSKAFANVYGFNPVILTGATPSNPTGTRVNSGLVTSNSSAGTFTPILWLQGNHAWSDNIAVTKAVPIRENLRFSLQGEFLNAFNHPNFGSPAATVTSSGFGVVGAPGGARQIELRANLEF